MTDLVSLPLEPSSNAADQEALAHRVAMSSEPSAEWHFLKSLLHETVDLRPSIATASAASVSQSVFQHTNVLDMVDLEALAPVAVSSYQHHFSIEYGYQVDSAPMLAYVPHFDYGLMI